MSVKLDLRGAGLWWIKRYLELLGGVETSPGVMSGPGWTATLTEGTHQAFRTVFPQVTVEFTGEPAAVNESARQLRQMANRGGG